MSIALCFMTAIVERIPGIKHVNCGGHLDHMSTWHEIWTNDHVYVGFVEYVSRTNMVHVAMGRGPANHKIYDAADPEAIEEAVTQVEAYYTAYYKTI